MDPVVSFPEGWTPPRELARALPRDVRLSGRGLAKAILASVFLVASLPVFFWMRDHNERQAAQIEALRTGGRETLGAVTRLWLEGKSSTPTVAYAFSMDGRSFQGKSSAPDQVWKQLRVGGPLPLRFLPADPNINHPSAWEQQPLPAWLPLLLPAIFVTGGLVILAILRREAGLLAEGMPAPGVIAGCRRVKGGWAVRYQFRMKDGAIAKGRSQTAQRMTIGTTICILYAPQNPRRNHTYPMCSYRLDLL